MIITWVLVYFLVSDSAWGRIIPIEPTSNEVQKRVDNILRLSPAWQAGPPILPQVVQSSGPQIKDLPKIDILRTQNPLLQTFAYPQAEGLNPQTEQFVNQSPEKLETQVPVNISPSPEQVSSIEKLELQTPQTQALQRFPVNPVQYYQLQQQNPYQDPRLIHPSNSNYYQYSPPNKENYQTPNTLREVLNSNKNFQQLQVPSQTLTAPKETFWNPANNSALVYESLTEDYPEEITQIGITDKPKSNVHATVRTVPKHYKFEKNSGSKEKIKKDKVKNKNKTKNYEKGSSDHILTESTRAKNGNDWVPIVRKVPKHYTFENNSLDSKDKAKSKKKLKGEPVEKVNKPKNYIFEEGTLVKKFKKNKFLDKELLENDALNKESNHKLNQDIEEDTHEKESQIIQSPPPKSKSKHKKSQDQVNSESYHNHKGVNNGFHHDNFNEFNGHLNGAQSHGAAPPPDNKDRMMFHMVGHDGPMSYKWGFDTGSGAQRQYRFEERDKDGIVKGQFGYLDDKGKFRKMNYNAHPVHGFSMEPADGTFDDLKPK